MPAVATATISPVAQAGYPACPKIARQCRRCLVRWCLGCYGKVAIPVTADGAVDPDPILQQLTAGTGGPILVADFQAFSSAPRLSHLLSDRAPGRPVYQVDPLGALSQDRAYIPIADLAAQAVGSFNRTQPPAGRAYVVGYCSAAALAMAMAALLAPARETTAVLFRPSWPANQAIQATFTTLAANLGAGQLRCPDLDGDPGHSISQMEQLLHGKLQALITAQGLDEADDTFTELLLTYRSWLAFLLACRNHTLQWPPDPTTAVTVLSDTPGAVTIPGLTPAQFTICPLPEVDDDNPLTPHVTQLLVAQITPAEVS